MVHILQHNTHESCKVFSWSACSLLCQYEKLAPEVGRSHTRRSHCDVLCPIPSPFHTDVSLCAKKPFPSIADKRHQVTPTLQNTLAHISSTYTHLADVNDVLINPASRQVLNHLVQTACHGFPAMMQHASVQASMHTVSVLLALCCCAPCFPAASIFPAMHTAKTSCRHHDVMYKRTFPSTTL